MGKENACRDRQASKEIGELSGVQGEVSAGGDHHKQMPKMREDLHFPVKCTALAKILPGLSKKAQT